MASCVPDARRAPRLGAALTAALTGYVIGTALQLQQPALWSLGAYAALAGAAAVAAALAALAAFGRRWRWGVVVLPWLLAGALAAFAAAGLRAVAMQSRALDPALEGRDVQVTGVISGLPQRGDTGWRMQLEVEQAWLAGQPVTLPPRLQLAWYEPMTAADKAAGPPAAGLRAGDRWQWVVRLKAPHGNANPHGYDYELRLWEQGIGATGYVRAGPQDAPPRLLAEAVAQPLQRLRQRVRDRILAEPAGVDQAGGQSAARRHAGIVAALVTGDQNAIGQADWDVFRATGVAHLMSISGLHITMFAWLAAALVGRLWRRAGPRRPSLWLPAPHAALIGGLLLATGYALFSGWGVPAQRTVLMLATVALLRLAGLRWPWWLTWLLACAAVLAVDPWAMMQAGFWLSFVAVGILFASDDSAAAGAASGGIRARFQKLLREQTVVTLALTPLTLLLFGQASVVGLLANLVAIPAVTLVITPLAMLGLLWPPLWSAAAWALAPLAWLLQTLASWPFASFALPAAPPALGLAAVAGGLLLALRWPWPLRLAGLPLLLAYALWQPARPAPGRFELLAPDVGQGSAVLVRTAGHTLLYDAGPRYTAHSDAGQRVLTPLLRALGERVDTLLLSHRDSDHAGGAAAVLAMQPGAALLTSIAPGDAPQPAPAIQRCQAGQRWRWDGVEFELLHPDPAGYDHANARKTNALSCVLRVRAESGAAALLTGDIEAAQEAALARQQPDALRADLLLAPHHGSHSSSSAALLDAVQPRLALIQSGYRNRFGHPAPEVLARYRAHGIRIADSPSCGAMFWRSDQPDQLRCQRDLEPRYWQHHPKPAGHD